MGENGDSVLKVVRLFIDNINESTKNTTKEMDKLSNQMAAVKTKINTPPRNEELSAQVKLVENKSDSINTNLVGLISSIKTMITTVRAAAAVLTIAVLLAAGVIHYNKAVETKTLNDVVQKIENCLEKMPIEGLDKFDKSKKK